jgi:GNAT superfamily N-acetyltransferase
MTIQVRQAHRRDAAQLVALVREHAAYERGQAQVREADILAILDAPIAPTNLVVADDGDLLVGYAAFTFDFAFWLACRFVHLDCLFVKEDARGKTIGKRLFQHVCQSAAAAGVSRVEWQTPDWNIEAIRFYGREGGLCLSKMRFTKLVRSTA